MESFQLDRGGGAVIAGVYEEGFELGPTPLVAAPSGSRNAFVARLDRW